MPKTINNHVERLHRYLPFSPNHDQIYEEYQREEDSLNLDTLALRYLKDAASSSASLVILTGDAGHGKTHLCRRLLQDHLGYSELDARKLINEKCDGSQHIEATKEKAGAIPLRIFKDFSEFTIEEAATNLEAHASRTGELLVVCANEGRLRAILKSPDAGDMCKRLNRDFSKSFDDGLASRDGDIHIVNLNFQSVASRGQPSLVWSALHEWAKGNRWRACKGCDSKPKCSIYHNREMLTDSEDGLFETRRARIEDLFATVERLGTVVTIREILMSLAYILTGGLRCSDVHERVSSGESGWQSQYTFYNLLFAVPESLQTDCLSRVPVLLDISRLDPGMRAGREVDERLLNRESVFSEGQIDLEFKDSATKDSIDGAKGIDQVVGNPTSRKERDQEAQFVRRAVRALRRRLFFEEPGEGIVLSRLGFEHGDEFEEIVRGEIEPARMARLKHIMIGGLHAIQGLSLGAGEPNLHLIDPAFGGSTSHAAIIASRITSKNVKLLPMASTWRFEAEMKNWALAQAVDWLDRTVVLRLEIPPGDYMDLPLDLLMFDCIARAGKGYVGEGFYSHDLRKALNFLGRVAERSPHQDGEISLVLNRSVHSVSIDDGVINVSGGGY
jgi:hypothetical protein